MSPLRGEPAPGGADAEWLEAALAEAPACLALVGPSGRVRDTSRRLAELLGQSREALRGAPAQELWALDDATHARLRAGEAIEVPVETAEGRRRGRLRAAVVGGGSARAGTKALEAGASKVPRDTAVGLRQGRLWTLELLPPSAPPADLGALAERLRGAHREQTLGRLAASVAHDFNNLLTVIGAHAALLDDPGVDSWGDDVEAIHQAARQGRLLTSRLLSLTERQIRQPRRVSVGEVLRELTPALRATLGDGRRLDVQVDPGAGWVHIDPGLLQQVILALVDNARTATAPDGRVSVSARSAVTGPGGAAQVEIAIQDDGAGMSEAVRARATEAFFTTRPVGSGSGLGLTHARAIVEGARGGLQLESAPGVGTTVRLWLPRSRAPSGVLPVRTAGLTETILLVEDQLGVRRATRRILRRAGYRVFEAAHAEDALALATTYPGTIHVLLTDVVMPGESGPRLAARLLEQRPELAVLFMSGYAEDVDEVRAAVERGQGFLAKPFAPEELLRRVREALGEGAEVDAEPSP